MDTSSAISDLQQLQIDNYRRIWKPFMERYDCRAICELGVYKAENFLRMIEHHPDLAVAVDAWRHDGIVGHNDSGFSQTELDGQYELVKQKLSMFSFVQLYRDYTDQVASRFSDFYFDFVYVDGDHSYEGCLRDIEAWYPKVKPGKFLVGDDYRNGYTSKTKMKLGVKQAVHFFAQTYSLSVYELPHHGWTIVKPA